MNTSYCFLRRLELGADPRRRRSLLPGDHHRRGDNMNLGCRITFRPESPVEPSVSLLAAMCAMRIRPADYLPRPKNDNLRKESA